jgi:hypothetical protein
MLADKYILSFISLSAYIQPTEFYQLLLLTSTSVFQLGGGSRLDIKKYQHSSKLCSLCAMPISLPHFQIRLTFASSLQFDRFRQYPL